MPSPATDGSWEFYNDAIWLRIDTWDKRDTDVRTVVCDDDLLCERHHSTVSNVLHVLLIPENEMLNRR